MEAPTPAVGADCAAGWATFVVTEDAFALREFGMMPSYDGRHPGS